MRLGWVAFSFPVKVALVVGLLFGFVVVLTLPSRTYGHTPDSHPTIDGFQGFSGGETHPVDGYRFSWALEDASLIYANVPRYTPLNLHLRLNLQRPDGVPPGRIEIYERSTDPPDELRRVTTLEYNPNDPNNQGLRDFYLTIPARESGKGLLVEFKSNAFKVQGDRRALGFMFGQAELSLPRTHLLKLFWPQPYWLAGLVLLALVVAWGLRAGLTSLEVFLLGSMIAFVLVTMLPSTYQHSWWLLLIASATWAAYYWEGRNLARRNQWSVWPLLFATALVLVFFLFSPDAFYEDMDSYHSWSASVQANSIWNIYNYNYKFNYLPLMAYLLAFYNLLVYPLGLQDSYLAWRIAMSVLYLVTIGLLSLTYRAANKLPADAGDPKLKASNLNTVQVKPKLLWERASVRDLWKQRGNRERKLAPTEADLNDGSSSPQWLVLIAFSAGFFYNSTLWGQADIPTVLALVGAFWLVYRGAALGGGLALGIVVISKPQAWFVLPLLGWALIRRCGWKRASFGIGLGGALALLLSAITFGFDPNAVVHYFGQDQFLGSGYLNNPIAFNLNYLVLGTAEVAFPAWMVWLGLGMVSLVMLGVLLTSSRPDHPLKHYGLAANLLVVTCFSWLIKMRERYLIFGMPFLGLAAMQERRYIKPFLLLSWMQLIQLVIALYQRQRWQTRTLPDNFYWWTTFLNQEWVRRGLSALMLVLFCYFGLLYLQQLKLTRPKAEAKSPEMAAR